MQYNVKHILIVTFFLNQFNFCFGQSPLLDTLIRYQRVDDLIDSIHFSTQHLKSNKVKTLKEYTKDGYYSRDKDSLYLMKEEEYNENGHVIKRVENDFSGGHHVHLLEYDANECFILGSELINDKKIIIEKNTYESGKLIEHTRKFTYDTNKKNTFKYDSLGHLIEQNEYCLDEKTICSSDSFKYDTRNRLIEIVKSTKNDGIYGITKFIYDSLSRIVSKIELDKNSIEDIYKYYYTVNNGVIKVEINHPEEKEIYCFGDKLWNIYLYDGKKIEEEITISFTDNYKISKVETNWPLRKKSIKKRRLFCGFLLPKYQKVEVKYNPKGLPVSKKEFTRKHKNWSEDIYEYNDKNLLVKKTELVNGKIDDIWFYEYTYW